MLIASAGAACAGGPGEAPPVSTPVASSPAAAVPTVNACGKYVVKPSSLILTCADANTVLDDLHWSGWGSATAHATGTLRENDCAPDCADGKVVSVRTEVTVSGLSDGHYDRLQVTATPLAGDPHDYDLRTTG
ncbi:hypothetical protein [Amycolatopsis benzoatilytica]|uniref:hypothetical protein n=1 Tax=Amycolatopsis benzoatilytica TaxID=346045 RepID=UPI00035D0CA9|nr:hypothetical protein [Amycolatopsis benzoatilytica]